MKALRGSAASLEALLAVTSTFSPSLAMVGSPKPTLHGVRRRATGRSLRPTKRCCEMWPWLM
ncbi:MAG: hypothetical protein EBR34_15915 [Sphingomonadaceae bacterium]|nr:hypothetical protein [Sphingomonadaceae bacterium]